MNLELAAAIAAVLGGVAGSGSSLVAERLAANDEIQVSPVWLPLVRDPLVQALDALIWAALVLTCGLEFRTFAAALMVLPMVQVAVTDLRYQYVYLVVPAVGAALGILLSFTTQPESWTGLVGAAAGAGVFGLLYLLGILVGRWRYEGQRPLALGDVWIAAMVGSVAGAQAPVALLSGVVLAVPLAVPYMLAGRGLRAFAPYGPALCLGGLIGLWITLRAPA